jgi:hypothetical protein
MEKYTLSSIVGLLIVLGIVGFFVYFGNSCIITKSSLAPGCTEYLAGCNVMGGCWGKTIATNLRTEPETPCLQFFEAGICNDPLVRIQNNCQDNFIIGKDDITLNSGGHMELTVIGRWYVNNVTENGSIRSIIGRLGATDVKILFEVKDLC